MHIFHTIQMNEVSNMPLLYMFYLNIDDSRDLGNSDRPFLYLTNSAFLLESVFHLIVGSNWTKVCTVHGRVRVSMSIWVNSWCEFFTFPLTQLFPLGWKSWLINQIIVGNLVFHQIIVSINFFFIVTQINFFYTYSSNRKLNSSLVKSYRLQKRSNHSTSQSNLVLISHLTNSWQAFRQTISFLSNLSLINADNDFSTFCWGKLSRQL